MAVQIIDNAKVWVGGYDLSGDTNAFAIDAGVELKENTTLGNTSIRRLPGMKKAGFSVEGFWDDGATGDNTDTIVFNNVGSNDLLLSMAPETGADGEAAFFQQVIMGEYSGFGQVGEVFPFSVSGELSSSELVRATIMHNASRSSSGNGTGRQLGAVSSSQKVYAAMHVIATTGSPTLDVTVESDDNAGFSSATTRGTFTQMTAIGSQWLTPVDGAITDDYWRVAYTFGGTGSIEFIVLIGIQ